MINLKLNRLLACLLACTFSLLSITSCEKEQSITSTPSVEETSSLNIFNLLTDEEDADNDRINKVLYFHTKAIQSVLQNEEMLHFIQEEVEKDKKGYGISISSLIENNSTFRTILLSELQKVQKDAFSSDYLSTLDCGDDILSCLRSNFFYNGKQQFPVIYKITSGDLATPRGSGDIVVAIAEGVTDDDAVLAYRDDNSESFLLSEEEALQSEDEIFFVGVGDTPDDNENQLVVDHQIDDQLSGEASLRSNVTMELDRHQIKDGFRFDNNKRSEIRAFYLYFFPNDDDHFIDRWDFNQVKIHKNDIGNSVIFQNNLGGFNLPVSDFFANKQVFLGAWEYDWYASQKLISNSCSTFDDHQVATQRKFSGDVYFKDCGVVQGFWPFGNSHEIFSNEKCMFDVRRW